MSRAFTGSGDPVCKYDSADSAGSGATTAEPLAAVLSKDLRGKGKASQDTSAAPKPAASQLPQHTGKSQPQGKPETSPQASAQSRSTSSGQYM